MRSSRASFSKIHVSYFVAFATLLLISTCIFRLNAAGNKSGNAQESGSPPQSAETQSQDLQAPASKYDKAIFQKSIPSGQLAFLNQLAGSSTNDVIHDKQFRKLMHSVIPDCMFHYGRDMPLSDALDKVLAGSRLPVQIREGRYVMVSGRSGPYLAGRGFVWIDMLDGIALGGFYFRPINGEPTPTLTIFSRQLLKKESLKMSQFPAAFAEDLNQWSADSNVPLVTTRYSIADANKKVLLEHNEDYCSPADPTRAPAEGDCEQMNADAADIDMNAAYYLEQTHHATNGTAWMITGDDQVAWIRVRDDTCRVGPDPLRCHIRMTRERTHKILNEQ
jgi:uncharacterized protein YecT (DUF1311 family)